MSKHQYRLTLEYLSDAQGNVPDTPPVQFVFANHDNLFAIMERLSERDDFTPETAREFGLGLKLFSEVMLTDRDNPLFAELRPQFVEFMKKLKKK